MIHDFDADDSGSVDYGEFLTSFFRLSVEHKQELSLEADYTSHKVRDKMKAKEKKAIEKFAKVKNLRPHQTAIPFYLTRARYAVAVAECRR